MKRNAYPPTALETKTCPPHRWSIDCYRMGICLKCGEVKDFKALQKKQKPPSLLRAAASRGGKKNLGRTRKNKKGVRT